MKSSQILKSVLAVLVFSIHGAWGAAHLINGAGATFPFPLYSKWFSEYQKVKPDVQINYQSIGSGGGIRQLLERTVDFGATDAPMTDAQLAKATQPILHLPMALGAVVFTYNLTGVAKGLKLSPEILADLYLGKIQKWNDSRIAHLNPQTVLPNETVIIVHRSDGSGTSAILTDYLSKTSPEWKTKVGSGTSVNWPVGLGGKGNEGVSGLVKQTPGTLGYVELIYAENNHLPYAAVQNSGGEYVLPSTQSVRAAAEGMLKKIPEDFRVSITHPQGKKAYPLSAFTYLLIYQKMPRQKGAELLSFLEWALKDGQTLSEALNYAPLPSALVTRVRTKLKGVALE